MDSKKDKQAKADTTTPAQSPPKRTIKYSVLMSVYAKENPNWLRLSIQSMLDQTIKPSEFVLVEDGPLTKDLYDTIEHFEHTNKGLFNIIKLQNNIGLGPALKVGVESCHNNLIARMDSDDFSAPTRIEKQLQILQQDPGIDIVGSNVNEFIDTPSNTVAAVILPEFHQEIFKFAKKRCPFRHCAIIFKKGAILKAGNYRDYHLCEDYDLYTRMLQNGCQCYNIQEPLTLVRTSKDFYKRRGGIKYLRSILSFKREQLRTGFFSKKEYLYSTIPHILVCLMPNFMRNAVYKKLLRQAPQAQATDADELIRVLHIVPNMNSGGLENFIMNLYREIDPTKIQFDFMVHYEKRGDFDDEIERHGGKIYRTRLRDNHKIFQYIRDINKFYKEHPEYRIIHCHMNSIAFIHFLVAAKDGVRIRISHSHNSSTEKTTKGRVKALLMKPVKYISTDNLACSHEAGKYLYKDYPFNIIPNAINTTKFQFNEKKRQSFRKKLHIQDDQFVIGHIGRFTEQKNHPFVIDTFYKIHQKNPTSILLLAGTGNDMESIKQYVHSLGISQSVKFLGAIKNTDSFYSAIDVFVLPSLFEGLPVVGVEAQASGVPCFFSNTITQELSISDKAHFLPISHDKDECLWAKKILTVATAKKRSERKGHINNSAYDSKKAATRLVSHYKNLLAHQREQSNTSLLFIISYTLMLIAEIFYTLPNADILLKALNILGLLGMLLYIYKRNTEYTSEQILLYGVLIFFALLSSLLSQNTTIAKLILLIIATYQFGFSRCISLDVKLRFTFVTTVILLSLTGIIENATYLRSGITRYSFGFAHPNTFGLYTVVLLIEKLYIDYKTNKSRAINNILGVITILINLFLSGSRTATIIAIAALCIYNIKKSYLKKISSKPIFFFFIQYSFIILTILSLVLVLINNAAHPDTTASLNNILSYRPENYNLFFTYYGISVFGQKVPTMIFGRPLDNLYISLLIRNGLVVYAILTLLSILTFKRLKQQKDFFLAYIMMLFLIYGLAETSVLKPNMNVFILGLSYGLQKEDRISK